MTYELNNKKGAPLGRLLFLNFDAFNSFFDADVWVGV